MPAKTEQSVSILADAMVGLDDAQAQWLEALFYAALDETPTDPVAAARAAVDALNGGAPDEIALSVTRQIGEVWQGPSGRYFTKNKDGHVVPAPGPGGQKQPQQQGGQQQAQPEQKGRKSIISRLLGALGVGSEPIPKGPSFEELQKLTPSERLDHAPARDAFAKKMQDDPNRQRAWAALGNGNPQAAQEAVRQKAQKLIDGCSVYRREEHMDVLDKILDGGVRNQFQVGKSTALYDPNGRAMAELKGQGVPADTPPDQRPMYGYFSDGSVHPDKEAAGRGRYGDIVIKMKPDLKGRATVSFGDSFSGARNGEFMASATDQVHHDSINPAGLANVGMNSLDSFEAFDSQYGTYIEAQVHGGIAPTDIESVQFRGEPPPEIQAKLKALNIPWSSY